MVGLIHDHYEGLNSIFSPDDLQDLYAKMLLSQITDNFFIGLVTAEGTAYILQVQDRQTFIEFGNKYLAGDKIIDFTERYYKGKYNLASDNKATNEKNFLKMMNDLNMGVTLAGMSYDPSTPSDLSLFNNFQLKSLDDFNHVKNTNCN